MSQHLARSWLLLLPLVPPQPSSLRVRVWRRLQQIGAVAVKNAAYALPDTDESLEDLTWLRQEIVDAGGGALLLRARGLETTDDEIVGLFREERNAEYLKLADEAWAFADALRHGAGAPNSVERTMRQFEERMGALRAIDFFEADGAADTEEVLRAVREAVHACAAPAAAPAPRAAPEGSGRLWVTRAGVYVDRLACAWMIRRFVDPQPRFGFVAPGGAVPAGGIPFDMAGVELGHHDVRCSAEVMAERCRPEDEALRALAEVVHDLDLKDQRFGRAEAPGLKRLLDGICSLTEGDEERIRAASPLFDALYAGFV